MAPDPKNQKLIAVGAQVLLFYIIWQLVKVLSFKQQLMTISVNNSQKPFMLQLLVLGCSASQTLSLSSTQELFQ